MCILNDAKPYCIHNGKQEAWDNLVSKGKEEKEKINGKKSSLIKELCILIQERDQ